MPKALPLFAVEPVGSLGDNGALMLYTRYSEMVYFAASIHDPKNIAELHAMRISAKRLRYTMEIFAPAYHQNSAAYDQLLTVIKSCQEQIGEIHDCDVRIEQIREYMNQNSGKKPEIKVGLAALIDEEVSARQKLYDSFAAYWENLAQNRTFERKFVDSVFSARLPGDKALEPAKNGRGKSDAASGEQQG
jgi:hypothetical protein